MFSKYIHHVKRQSKHVQEIHALFFAGVFTTLLAVAILYFEYGFWRPTYSRSEVLLQESTLSRPQIVNEPKPPTQVLGSFFKEAKKQFSAIGSQGASLLESSEYYIKE